MTQLSRHPFDDTDRVKLEVQPPEGYHDAEICERCERESADGAKFITYVNDEFVGHMLAALVKRLYVYVNNEVLMVYLVCGYCGHIRQISEGPIFEPVHGLFGIG